MPYIIHSLLHKPHLLSWFFLNRYHPQLVLKFSSHRHFSGQDKSRRNFGDGWELEHCNEQPPLPSPDFCLNYLFYFAICYKGCALLAGAGTDAAPSAAGPSPSTGTPQVRSWHPEQPCTSHPHWQHRHGQPDHAEQFTSHGEDVAAISVRPQVTERIIACSDR